MPRKKPLHGHDTRIHKLPKNLCFGCGKDNPDGMHLHFIIDEERGITQCHFNLPKRYQGPPGHVHGGVIATILDEAMGKVNKLRSVVALTKTMNIEYLKPVPLGKTLIAEGWEESVHGRKHTNVAEIRDLEGNVLARCSGLFIAIDPEKMFERFMKEGGGTGPLAYRKPK
jgi:uncharacterized protein (TIGR00369 family)